jgi:hypothetical protein
MKQARSIAVPTVLALSLAACSGGGGGGSGGGQMYVTSCSLGCTNGLGGNQVSCGIINTFQNQEIGVLFAAPVDFASVNKSSFQVFDVSTGTVPPGSFLIDPNNPHRLIFRPKLTFDPQGNPIFGFSANASYQIKVPGTAQSDPPPYVESTGSKENQSRMLCTITTDQGLIDPVPGDPKASVFVDTINPLNGQITKGVPANGATSVHSATKITLVFDDLMNLGTIVIPATGLAPFITVKIDPDGNTSDPSDQVPIQGLWSFAVNQVALTTSAVFTPSAGLPSAGSNLASPRKIVVNIPNTVVDLVGNPISNAGNWIFVPEVVLFPPATLPPGGEQFTNQNNMDAKRTGADWGESQPGRLLPGLGGGSGRLGDLIVKQGQTLSLTTSPTAATGTLTFAANPVFGDQIIMNGVTFTFDIQIPVQTFLAHTLTFAVNALNASPDPLVAVAKYELSNSDTILVTYKLNGSVGNAFTLGVAPASVAALSGLTLSGGTDSVPYAAPDIITNFDFQANPGTAPPPIQVANGEFEFATIEIQNGGTLLASGNKPLRLLARGRGLVQSLGVVNVSGQDRGEHKSNTPLGQLGGFGGPGGGFGGKGGDRSDETGTDLFLTPTGMPIGGITNPGAFTNGHPGLGVGLIFGPGSGLPGDQYPSSFPTGQQIFNGLATDNNCVSHQVGGPGSGGAYSTDGGTGNPLAIPATAMWPPGAANAPPPTPGGDAASVGLEPPTGPLSFRKLTPKFGYLRGGAGGGGAGAHIEQTTSTQGFTSGSCLDPAMTVGSMIVQYASHSGGAGGGGGGATQFQAGRTAQIDGVLDASGGDGGSRFTAVSGSATQKSASPGGAGSGGAILVQSRNLQLSVNPGRLNIAGGAGGLGVTGSTGGAGGTGLVRAEGVNPPLNPIQVAMSVNPLDPLDPTSQKWLSVGTWVFDRVVPDSFSGAESCWMRPTGNFFGLTFAEDDFSVPTSPVFGWNMDLILQIGANTMTVAYRGSTVFGGQDPQTFWTDLINRDLMPGSKFAPVVVRFQGAKATANITDFCNIDPFDPQSPILAGSLTPWVRHPAELNDFIPQPDMVRFVIIFDASHNDLQMIKGVTNLRIEAIPD